MIFVFCSYTKSLGISPVLLLYKAYIGELDTYEQIQIAIPQAAKA